jgi:hypothetical protein
MWGQIYSAHACATPTRNLNVLEATAVDGGSFLSEELLSVLQQPQLNYMTAECVLSLHALSGLLSIKLFNSKQWLRTKS